MTGRARRGLLAADDGQIMLLSLGFAVVAILLLTAVVSASAVHLDRKRLLALADLTALACADALDESVYYAPERPLPDGGGALVLTEESVRRAATDFLASAAPPTGLADLRLVSATTDDGTVTVVLSARTHPVLLSAVTAPWADGIALAATASATSR